MKALVVEPKRVYQAIVKELCDSHGVEAVFAETGEQAVDAVQAEQPELICSSMHLPDITGMALCSKLKSQFIQASCPFILLTADQNPGLTDEAMDAGVTEVIQKSDLDSLGMFMADYRQHHSTQLAGRVLLVEDNKAVSQFMTALLENMGLTAVTTASAESALEHLQNEAFDLVVADLSLKERSGIWLIRSIRSLHPPQSAIPVLVTTAFNDQARRIEVFKAGANDYLTKPIIEEELVARVTNLVSAKQLLDKVERQREQLRQLAMTDQLTSLYSRHFLAETAPREIAEAYRHGSALSLIVMDIDHFKQVNDEHGHSCGDTILKEVALTLQTKCRLEDVIVRFGGEEFVVLLPHCERDRAAEKAEKLRRAIEQLQSNGVSVTASFGVTALGMDSQEDFDQLFSRADSALYAAKDAGRNRVVAG